MQEGAALAAIINSPNGYDPANGKQSKRGPEGALRLRHRRHGGDGHPAGQLAGKRDPLQAAALPAGPAAEPVRRPARPRAAMVRDELTRLGYSDSEIDGGGLRITTTLHRKAMTAAEQGVARGAARPQGPARRRRLGRPADRRAARHVRRPGLPHRASSTGPWRAGRPGSTFKPFALATGLELRLLAGVRPSTATRRRRSPARSSATRARAAASPTATSACSRPPSTRSTPPTSTSSTRMDDGVDDVSTPRSRWASRATPRVSTRASRSCWARPRSARSTWPTPTAPSPTPARPRTASSSRRSRRRRAAGLQAQGARPTQAISEDVAADTSYALQQVTAVGTGTNANVIGRPIAGKTGTATTDAGNVRSSWFVGYTPQLVDRGDVQPRQRQRAARRLPRHVLRRRVPGPHLGSRSWAPRSRARRSSRSRERAYLEQTAEGHEPDPPTPEPDAEPDARADAERRSRADDARRRSPSPEAPPTSRCAPASPPPSEQGPPRERRARPSRRAAGAPATREPAPAGGLADPASGRPVACAA